MQRQPQKLLIMCRRCRSWLCIYCVRGRNYETIRIVSRECGNFPALVDRSGAANDSQGMSQLPHPRFLLFLGVLVAACGGFLLWMPPERALVFGFDAAAAVFLASCLPLWNETEATASRDRAARDDGGRVLLLVVSMVTLVAVLAALVRIAQIRRSMVPIDLTTVLVTLGLAWVFVNTLYAFHYAHLYYDQSEGADVGGLEFPGGGQPVFADFNYFAMTIGMTCQVSDVAVQTTLLRRTVLLHGLASFLFNLGVVAMVVNVLAGIL